MPVESVDIPMIFFIRANPGGAMQLSPMRICAPRERVSAALANSGFDVPSRRVTVNLSPAGVRKDGTAFDLPIAIGVLVASGQLPAESGRGRWFLGELGLDGTVRAVRRSGLGSSLGPKECPG